MERTREAMARIAEIEAIPRWCVQLGTGEIPIRPIRKGKRVPRKKAVDLLMVE